MVISQVHGHDRGWGFIHLLVPALAVHQLPPDLLGYLVMVLNLDEIKKRLLLFRTDVSLVPLDEAEESLVPQHRQLPSLTPEAQEVEHKSVNDSVGEGVLLVAESTEENRVAARIIHLRDLDHSGARVEDRDRVPGEDGGKHYSFSQSAVSLLAKRQ